MAGKITDLTELTSGNLADADLAEVVDTSDTSMAPTGTNKKALWSTIWTYIKSKADPTYATAAQGATADSAVQPGDLATVATSGSASDLGTGTLPAARLPAPGTTTLGGVKRNTGAGGQFVSGVDTDGSLLYSTPSGSGDVVGPASATDNGIPLYDGTTGKLLKDSTVTSTVLTVQSAGTASVRAIGTGGTDACAGNDSRLSDARMPTSHASSHVTGGSDKIRDASASQDGLMTAAYGTKLDGIEALADVTDAGNIGPAINGTSSKGSLADGDKIPILDSAASNVLKYILGSTLKALFALTGAITSSTLTMTTARLLGRTTGSTGAVEELTVGGSLVLASGVLSSRMAIVTETGTTRTWTTADAGKWIRFTNASGCSYTIPGSTASGEEETAIEQAAAGQVTLVESSFTINKVSTLKTRVQSSVIGLKFVSSSVATLTGDTQ